MKEEKERSIAVEVMAAEDVSLPHYASAAAAGADVRAYLTHPFVLKPQESALIPTGLHVAVPHGYEMQVRPRSGLAHKHQLTVLNAPGTVDSDFRGHVHVLLINHGKEPFTIEPGMRIAQLIFAPVVRAHFTRVDQLDQTERSGGGFGHTGLH